MHSWGDKGLQWVAGEGSQKGRRGGGLPFHSGLTKTTRRRDGGNNGQHRGKSFRDRGRATVVALCGHAPHLSIRHPLNSHGHLQHRQPAIVPWTTAFIEIFCFASRDQRDLKTWLENWKKEWTLEGGMLGGGEGWKELVWSIKDWMSCSAGPVWRIVSGLEPRIPFQ